MPESSDPVRSTAELLAEWRAAGRDSVAARAASHVAGMALDAAVAAEEAANEVEAAAKAALDSVEKARSAAGKARNAATQAAQAAALLLAEAQGDKVRANNDVELTERAESEARDAYHAAEGEARGKQSEG